MTNMESQHNRLECGALERFQILSLDGGGIKGIFSAGVLAAIEEDLNINVADHFDLIAGTSTGGIIAIGLGLGLRPKFVVNHLGIRGIPGILFDSSGCSGENFLRPR